MTKLPNNATIDRFTFRLSEDGDMYQCRGPIHRNSDGDEAPDPALWQAAGKLAASINKGGAYKAETAYSEKGWVEVYVDKV